MWGEKQMIKMGTKKLSLAKTIKDKICARKTKKTNGK